MPDIHPSPFLLLFPEHYRVFLGGGRDVPCHVLGGLEIIECSFATSTVGGSFLRPSVVGGRGGGMCIFACWSPPCKFSFIRVYARISVINNVDICITCCLTPLLEGFLWYLSIYDVCHKYCRHMLISYKRLQQRISRFTASFLSRYYCVAGVRVRAAFRRFSRHNSKYYPRVAKGVVIPRNHVKSSLRESRCVHPGGERGFFFAVLLSYYVGLCRDRAVSR